jgi:hypothetical protein
MDIKLDGMQTDYIIRASRQELYAILAELREKEYRIGVDQIRKQIIKEIDRVLYE